MNVWFSVQDNIALIVVLEAKFSNHGSETPGKRQLLCVVSKRSSLFLSESFFYHVSLRSIYIFDTDSHRYLEPEDS